MLPAVPYFAAIAVIIGCGTRIRGPVLRLVLNDTVVHARDRRDL